MSIIVVHLREYQESLHAICKWRNLVYLQFIHSLLTISTSIFVPFVLIHDGFSIMSYSGVSFCIYANQNTDVLSQLVRCWDQCNNAKKVCSL